MASIAIKIIINKNRIAILKGNEIER